MRSAPPRWVVGLFRRAARLAPARVRDRFADQRVALFTDIWREERPRAVLPAAVWLMALVAREVRASIGMHADERRRGAASGPLGRGPRRLGADLRYTVRSLRRAPWYAVTLSAVVALGIALTATVFALVDGVLFKPLPYRAPHELFSIRVRAGGAAGAGAASLRDLRAWRDAVPEAMFTAHATTIGYGTLGVINGPTVWSRAVDRDFWETVGLRPRFGEFGPADYDVELATRPVVITHGLWQRLFGGDLEVVNRTIHTGRVTFRVAGVLPEDFVFPTGEGRVRPDLLFPAVRPAIPVDEDASRSYEVIARIPSGLTLEAVRARLDAALRRGSEGAPERAGAPHAADAVEIVPLGRIIGADERPAAALIFAAMAVMVLLVAVNVGGLVGSRSLDRARESAARRALGATSFDLARLHLLEVGLLVVAGAGAGVAAAWYVLTATARRLPADILLLRDPAVDGRVIVAVIGAALLVAITATLTGLRVSRRASLTALLGQGAGAAAGRTRSVGHTVLQTGQVALAMLLVLGGALFVASLRNVWREDTGYDLRDTLFIDARVSSAPGGATAPARALALLPVLRSVPGVSAAGVIDTILLAGARRGSLVKPSESLKVPDEAEMIPVSSSFFEIAGIRPINGRLPSDAELDAGAPLAVVSERVARDYWPGRSAIGQTLTSKRATLTVVGMVKDSRFQGLDTPSFGEIYVPMVLALWTSPAPTYLVRSSLPEPVILPALVDAVRRFDQAASIRRAQPVEVALSESVKRRNFHAWLFGMLAAASLLVAGAGIFGLVATATARRTHEVGVRLALGSTHPQLVRLLLREQLAPVLAGVIVGGGVAAWAVRFVRSLLYGLSAYDISVWAIAAVVVIAVAALGTLVPASRITKVDPAMALRVE